MDNKTVINALSFDVEEWFHCTHLEERIERSQWDKYESRIEMNLRPILDLLRTKKVYATFFVLGWVAQRHPDLIKEIANQGHEIATHGWSHMRAYQQSPEEFEAELKQAIGILEQITGKPVRGHRAACFSLTSNTQWVIDLLIKYGIKYDSSIYPIIHDKYGMLASPRYPYILREKGSESLLEFPLSTYKFFGVNIPVAGGGYFRLYPYVLTRFFIKRINHTGKPVVVYLHPPEFDSEQPRIKMNLANKFRIYVGINNNFRKLIELLEDFRFSTISEVLNTRYL